MNKILLVGSNPRELVRLQQKLTQLEVNGQGITFLKARPGGVASFNLKHIDIVVYDVEELNSLTHTSIQQIRKLSFEGPIIITAHIPKHIQFNDFHNMEDVHLFEKPFIAAEFLGFFTKLLNNQTVMKCRHKRYYANQPATIQSYYTSSEYNVVIKNISKGGACIDGDIESLNTGDFIKIHLKLDEINKERVLCAQVVWSKKKGSQQSEAGLKFISSKSVYNHFMTENTMV